jgi:hypothetical protein
MPKILFLAAGNVVGQHRLNVACEERAIRNVLRAAAPYEFDVVAACDVEAGELLRIVTDEQPDIIHFSGHGAIDAVQFADRVLPAEVVKRIVRRVPSLWCVVLNACYSDHIAQLLTISGIPAVIGMVSSISDGAAADFAETFYRALARSRDIADAVEEARTQLMTVSPGEAGAPRFLTRDRAALTRRSAAHAPPSIHARINLEKGKPCIWDDDNDVSYVNFDLYVHNPPSTARAAVWRLHESYDDVDGEGGGMLRESTDAGHGFYLADIDTEDDYRIEAYLRLPTGGPLGLIANVTDAMAAHYARLSDEEVSRQGFTRGQVGQIIEDLRNGNLRASA